MNSREKHLIYLNNTYIKAVKIRCYFSNRGVDEVSEVLLPIAYR